MITHNLNEILSRVSKLNKEERAVLLNKISLLVENNEQPLASTRLTQLSGLGSSLWQGIDIDKYIDDERQW